MPQENKTICKHPDDCDYPDCGTRTDKTSEKCFSQMTPILQLHDRLAAIGGCSDGYCRIKRPVGMHTSGGCRCLRDDKYKAERVIAAYQEYVRTIEGSNAGI